MSGKTNQLEKMMDTLTSVIAVLLLAMGIALLVSLPVMWLWDWLMPDIFGLKEITWLQALGLTGLCSLLFKSSSSSKS